MEAFVPQKKGRPEEKIEKAIKEYMTKRGWLVIKMHGSLYQMGIPDLYCTHLTFGQRFVEVKLPQMKGSKFTAAQLEVFPQLEKHGAGVWILTAATQQEYFKLFTRSNLTEYMIGKL